MWSVWARSSTMACHHVSFFLELNHSVLSISQCWGLLGRLHVHCLIYRQVRTLPILNFELTWNPRFLAEFFTSNGSIPYLNCNGCIYILYEEYAGVDWWYKRFLKAMTLTLPLVLTCGASEVEPCLDFKHDISSYWLGNRQALLFMMCDQGHVKLGHSKWKFCLTMWSVQKLIFWDCMVSSNLRSISIIY